LKAPTRRVLLGVVEYHRFDLEQRVIPLKGSDILKSIVRRNVGFNGRIQGS
jgi:hypothetical protein